MELRVLQYFLAIAREQNIVRAAQSLHLTQPTLSTQIKNMEEELGKQLLIRGSKGSRKVTLTEEGMILRKRAEEILELVKKTENEISCSAGTVAGDVSIGTGETEGIRLIAKAAGKLKKQYPGIHYHISSGNAIFVREQLDKGLIDFGIVFGEPDLTRYESYKLPCTDVWGVLMPKTSLLAQKAAISPQDLLGQPLLLSQQEPDNGPFSRWMQCSLSQLDIVMTYNLLFNASLLVEEGFGLAVCLDGIINTSGDSKLCFRPLEPGIEAELYIIWKKYQLFSKPAEKFLAAIRENLHTSPTHKPTGANHPSHPDTHCPGPT